jgi:hypothetical protein
VLRRSDDPGRLIPTKASSSTAWPSDGSVSHTVTRGRIDLIGEITSSNGQFQEHSFAFGSTNDAAPISIQIAALSLIDCVGGSPKCSQQSHLRANEDELRARITYIRIYP